MPDTNMAETVRVKSTVVINDFFDASQAIITATDNLVAVRQFLQDKGQPDPLVQEIAHCLQVLSGRGCPSLT